METCLDSYEVERAIKLLVFYNGYGGIVRSLLHHISEYPQNKQILPPDGIKYGDEDETVEAVLWFLLVCMYGDYGTSPRFGWIENKEKAINFLNGILPEEVDE